jgi:alpha-galactosidase
MSIQLQNIRIAISYIAEGKIYQHITDADFSTPHFALKLLSSPISGGTEYSIKIFPETALETVKLELIFNYDFSGVNKIFANGFQSWTDSREFEPYEKIRKPGIIARGVMKKYTLDKYGDEHIYKQTGRKGIFHSHTYTYFRNSNNLNFIGSLSEKSGFTIIESHIPKKQIKIIKDCEGAIYTENTDILKFFIAEGDEKHVFDSYFSACGISPSRAKPVTGWTSWYNYYQNINEDVILENISAVKNKAPGFSVFQIDDGFQQAVGDWFSIDEKKFPRGMKFIASEIHKAGMLAGIWLAPFAAETDSELFRNKPEWILKDKTGNPVLAGGNWSRFYALDFYNSEVREYLKNVCNTVFNIWGYDMVKLDFLYAVSLIPQQGKSRGEVMHEAMLFLRECAGDKLILGCGVPLGSAFGLVDYCRIGCDAGLDWDDKSYMKYLHRERVSTLNAIVNTISRRHLDGRAFLNDPDVFLLREENNDLTREQKETLFIINAIFGSLVFTSDNLNHYSEEQLKLLKKLPDFAGIKDIAVKSPEAMFFEIKYTVKGSPERVLVNLNSKAVKFEGRIIEAYESRFIDQPSIPGECR